jgi:hypothetical protein
MSSRKNNRKREKEEEKEEKRARDVYKTMHLGAYGPS